MNCCVAGLEFGKPEIGLGRASGGVGGSLIHIMYVVMKRGFPDRKHVGTSHV